MKISARVCSYYRPEISFSEGLLPGKLWYFNYIFVVSYATCFLIFTTVHGFERRASFLVNEKWPYLLNDSRGKGVSKILILFFFVVERSREIRFVKKIWRVIRVMANDSGEKSCSYLSRKLFRRTNQSSLPWTTLSNKTSNSWRR